MLLRGVAALAAVGLLAPPATAVRRARKIGGGVLVRRAGNRACVWATLRGRVRAVGITTSRFASDHRAVRSAMRRVIAARADNKPGESVPAEPSAKSSMLGRPLASTGDRKVDRRMALYGSLNL